MTAKEKFMARARRQKIIRQAKELLGAYPPTLARSPLSPLVRPQREAKPPKEPKPPKPPKEHKPPKLPPPTPPVGWITAGEFAKAFNIAQTGLFRAMKKGRVRSIKIGHYRYVDPESYKEYREIARKNSTGNVFLAQAARREKAAARRAAKEA